MGTKEYMAPEILGQLPYDGIISDKFSLGQLLFTLVTGIFGFNSSSENDILYSLILNKHYEQYWNSPVFNNLNIYLKALKIYSLEWLPLNQIKGQELKIY